jgi:hypothetical protein
MIDFIKEEVEVPDKVIQEKNGSDYTEDAINKF